jgi:ATP-binding protein involved in chromosome partitioning
MVRSIDVKDGGVVDVTVSLTTPGCPIKSHFQTGVVKAVTLVEGVTHCNVGFDVLSDQEKGVLQQQARPPGGLPEGALAQVQNVICVGSGKGGVGKSSLTVNLAAALAAEGKRVGVLDADVWGYSIPRMLGSAPTARRVNGERKIIPLDAHGLKVMSIGFFVKEDEAVVWRGPMLHKALTQFLEDVAWGELDYLLIDLPPGTGDVSMTLAQLLPQAKFVIVTTPQPAAQKVARRSAEMADKVKLEIAGVIENMSGFTTPSGERFAIFGEGGGGRLADELEVPLLGTVPLTMALREQADEGTPLVFTDPDDPAAQAVRQAARGLVALSPDRAARDAGAGPGGRAAAGRHVVADGLSPQRRLEAALGPRVGAGAVEEDHGQQSGRENRHREHCNALGEAVDDRVRARGAGLERLRVHRVQRERLHREQRDRGERPGAWDGRVQQGDAERHRAQEEQVDRGQGRGHTAQGTDPRAPEKPSGR